jgi:hypothetical protein
MVVIRQTGGRRVKYVKDDGLVMPAFESESANLSMGPRRAATDGVEEDQTMIVVRFYHPVMDSTLRRRRSTSHSTDPDSI